jgi:hypothetical protein
MEHLYNCNESKMLEISVIVVDTRRVAGWQGACR